MNPKSNYLLMCFRSSLFVVLIVLLPGIADAQDKQLNTVEQTNTLLNAYDRITANERKLQLIAERTASIPQEDLENSELQTLITTYTNEKDQAERKVASITHYFQTTNLKIQVPVSRYQRFNQQIRSRIDQDPIYILTYPNNEIAE